jgi:SAM-dependent methyltransferase
MNESKVETTPLHTMNPMDRFSDLAADYAKYRPSYPVAAINSILEGLDNTLPLVAADIGAGTGISSRLLAESGVRVLAIEPNAQMRQAALPHRLVEFHSGTAEHTNLPNASVDLVVCFQSFHWFDPKLTLLEFRRILKPNGRLAVVWNDRDHHDEFTQSYSRLVQIASNHHPAESRLVSVDPLLASPLFPNVRCHTFTYRQELDKDGLIGRAMSVSYIPRSGLLRSQLVSELKELYNRSSDENSNVYLVYRTSVYLAQAAA